MKRKLISITTIICLIMLGIIAGASAETIDIAGPWLWMIAPVPFNKGGADSIDFDSLREASSGAVTEEMIANEGANVGDFVGDDQWTPGEISLDRPGWLDLAGNGNINDCLEAIGFIEGNVDHATSYALINIESKIDQDATMKVGSDDAIRVWLNGGEPVHTNAINRSTKGYQDTFEVNLNEGKNLLMVKVSEKERKWRMFVGLDVSDTHSIAFTLPENVDIDTNSVVGADGGAQVNGKLRNSFEYHDWSLPKGVFTDVAVTENATYFVWKPNTPQPGVSSIPYKSIMTLYLPNTIEDYETARGLYNNKALPPTYPYFMAPLPTETPTGDAMDADQIFTWWGVVKSFFRETIQAIFEFAIDFAIEELSKLHATLRFAEVFLEAGKVIYATTQEALENYRAEESAFNLITIALQNPSVTVEDFSQFMEHNIVSNDREARYLVMVPQLLDRLTMRMETYYYRQNDAKVQPPYPLLIRGDSGGGDMHLFWFRSEGGLETIRLNVPNKDGRRLWEQILGTRAEKYYDLTLVELLSFWAEGFGQTEEHDDFWDTWNNEWKNNNNTILNEDKAYITQRFLGTIKALNNLTLGHITLRELFSAVNENPPVIAAIQNTFGPDFGVFASKPLVFMNLPKYEEVPAYPIVTHHEFQFQSAAGAPLARPMSLADYPPFQELSPEVQALLLDYIKQTTRSEAIELDRNPIPEQTALLSNYPNPFNPETWLPYQLSEPAEVTLTIYDIQGRVVRDLDLGHQPAGMYHGRSRAAHWDGRNAQGESVASGLYFYTLKAGDFTATRKMLIRK